MKTWHLNLRKNDFAGGVVADIEESLRFIERNTRTALQDRTPAT
jgi:hypothetical protein